MFRTVLICVLSLNSLSFSGWSSEEQEVIALRRAHFGKPPFNEILISYQDARFSGANIDWPNVRQLGLANLKSAKIYYYEAANRPIVLWGQSANGDNVAYLLADSVTTPRQIPLSRAVVNNNDMFKGLIEVEYVISNTSGRVETLTKQIDVTIDPNSNTLDYFATDYLTGEFKGRTIAIVRPPFALTYPNNNYISFYIDYNKDNKFSAHSTIDSAGNYCPSEMLEMTLPFKVDNSTWQIMQLSDNETEVVIMPSNQTTALVTGFKMPDFSVSSINGAEIALNELIGKVVVICWWNISCAPCREEIPGLNTLVEKYENDDVIFLAVSTNSINHIEEYTKETPFKYQLTISNPEMGRLMGPAVPRNLIIDRDGIILFNQLGGSSETCRILDPIIEYCL